MKKTVFIFLLYSATAMAGQSPTVIYGASERGPNEPDQILVIQPADAPDPFGEPIVNVSTNGPRLASPQPSNEQTAGETAAPQIPVRINQSAEQNPKPFSETPTQQQNQIQNTLYEGGNRIYDIQSYPLKDIKTITEPNIDPTITTYPEY